eukprot:8993384-Pyramimonas_sp.AAC.1
MASLWLAPGALSSEPRELPSPVLWPPRGCFAGGCAADDATSIAWLLGPPPLAAPALQAIARHRRGRPCAGGAR